MTPPQASPPGTSASGETLPAVSLRLETLRKRTDFQRAARARRIAMPGFILQMRKRPDEDAQGVRVGYTCSKKVGNAVARNRAKRRLREAARLVLARQGRDGMDYVLIGRRDHTATLPFEQLQADLETALRKLHGQVT
ncbi:ribonuclease P protein component [uncultured Roseobacter sp.]|uniref:ribonuclease P protein component n=1 Tax=uncultured Roseobacter sp. TaxID=114847 RepID=UPI00263394B3|nr:ribonuclease P protein component [uncultured Roseobacter sp.]